VSFSATLGRLIIIIHRLFWKRSGLVKRVDTSYLSPPPESANTVYLQDMPYCRDPVPKVVSTSLLYSGATRPSLYESDIAALGIAKDFYGAKALLVLLRQMGNSCLECMNCMSRSPVTQGHRWPSSNVVLLGENRDDVLGAGRSTLPFQSQSCSFHTIFRVFRHDLRVYCSRDMSCHS